ncbi:hypothetical protein E2562_023422 [Oryza meyeriana var. granulata]|uniref:Uncharacterized protein n=1 Tax=Oryza meyeriana var. granulata TaxID=110450 RepID=A0A6G1FBB3_9ORYZ|nr:hypothetical protein E2562_023422 [Oryza meyeriana var. granulata]
MEALVRLSLPPASSFTTCSAKCSNQVLRSGTFLGGDAGYELFWERSGVGDWAWAEVSNSVQVPNETNRDGGDVPCLTDSNLSKLNTASFTH